MNILRTVDSTDDRAGWRAAIALVACGVLSACSTVEYGAVYDPALHGSTQDAGRTLVVYADPSIEEGIVFDVKVNRKVIGKVFAGTFLPVSPEPGAVELELYERFTGFGPMPETLYFQYPTRLTDFFAPQGLSQGIDSSVEGTIYLRLRKEAEEHFVECAKTKDTSTLCSRMVYPTFMERVDELTAAGELAGLKESL